MSSTPATLIAVDWGTTNFRAALLNADGQVLDRLQASRGIRHVRPGRFGAVLTELLGGWFQEQPGVPVIMAGMVGSVGGLVEVPYLPCPVSLDEMASAMFAVPGLDVGRDVLIVPGLSGRSVSGNHDVMRGEEIQIVGATESAATTERVLCLPGTHSKWAVLRGREVRDFSTSMTGDAFAALRDHTILGQFASGEGDDPEAFGRGLECASRPGGLLHHLFSARSEVLLGGLPAASASAYLSGVLIGAEVRAMVEALDCRAGVDVVGSKALTELYAQALRHAGCPPRLVDGNRAALAGLQRLARLAGVAGDAAG